MPPLDPHLIPLQEALQARATHQSKAFWQGYLKGDAQFRGVPMAGIRAEVHAFWTSRGLASLPLPDQKRLALCLLEETYAEDKLAGTLVLAERLMSGLTATDLPDFAWLFSQGHITDWNQCDWFCVKVLGPMVTQAQDKEGMARAISAWRLAPSLWQRRAACVAFVNLAPRGGQDIPALPEVIFASSEALVQDPARFAQTGVGWVLRELWGAEPAAVEDFANRHLARLSREGLRYIIEKMPAQARADYLDRHKRLKAPRARAQST